MDINDGAPEFDEPEPEQLDEDDYEDRPQVDTGLIAEPPHPVNWNLLTAEEAEAEWAELDRWVTWLRHTYGLPAAVVPPFWHHHQELVWELSALHIHWLCAYDPDQNGSAPSGWHRDFRRHPQPAPGLGGRLGYPPGPRSPDPADLLAR